jgi:tRNA A37 threonylcarbamoyladenosine biosynthesis protein TsaE
MYWIIAVILLLLFLVIRGVSSQKQADSKRKEMTRKEYGQKPLEFYHRTTDTCHRAFLRRKQSFVIDDITWNDLDLTEVFRRLNYTVTSAGSEELYCMIREPLLEPDEAEKRKDLIHRLEHDKELLFSLRDTLERIGFTGKYVLEDYLELLNGVKTKSVLYLIVTDLLYIPVIILLILKPVPGLVALGLLILFHISLYFREKAKLQPYLVSFSYVLRMIRFGTEISSAVKNEGIKEEITEIRDLTDGVKRLSAFSGIAMSMQNPVGSSNPIDVIFDYIRMLFHFDLMKFHQMLTEIREREEDIITLTRKIGTLDAVASVCYYRSSLQTYSEPMFLKNTDVVQTSAALKKIYHPLLQDPVSNSLEMKKNILLTGSNASGKSTFLKTVALNAVFAQSILTCLAKEYSFPMVRVMTSMSLRDDITSGKSYYMQEIEAILRILNASDENVKTPVFCCVDEVLRGTNTVERIAASAQILKTLSEKGVMAFAATHDIELASLLEEEYDNHHFEETYVDGNISFSYELKPGKATSRNAIKLLGALGYDGKLIERAEEMSETYMRTGKWECK